MHIEHERLVFVVGFRILENFEEPRGELIIQRRKMLEVNNVNKMWVELKNSRDSTDENF